MDVHRASQFLVTVIDDKAAQMQYLRLTDKESAVAWASFWEAIQGLYIFEVPQLVKDAIRRYHTP